MKKNTLSTLLLVAVSFSVFAGSDDQVMKDPVGKWKIGIAKTVITPQESMWLAGYAARNRPSEGTLHDLWAKAMVFEDERGESCVLITADILRIHKALSDAIRDTLRALYGFSRAQIMLNCSHTHSGPEVDVSRYQYLLARPELDKISSYSENFPGKIAALVGEALKTMMPAELFAANGVARFAVNRRNNNEADVKWRDQLNGPSDHAVPVIKAVDERGELIAILFGYACHPTVLDSYEWSGDYAGLAQLALEKDYPGVQAMFLQGAGGDQNPIPRRSVALAKQYGTTLAAAVTRVLEEPMKTLPSQLKTAYSEVELGFANPSPTIEELQKISEEASSYPGWLKNNAKVLIDQLKKEGELMTSYPYPIQVWNLGGQPIVGLGGELVVEYAIRLKQILGQHSFVLGYCNDVMAYIPSEKILIEGGYEGERSAVFTTPWRSDTETRILFETIRLAKEAALSEKL